MTREFLYNFIKEHRFSVLSTVAEGNKPESACVGIAVTPELKLIFDTVSDSRKYANLITNPNISFVIGWENGQTIQYEGIATNFSKSDLRDFLQLYLEAFPDGVERKDNWPNITYFVVEPIWIRFSDFTESTPRIEEFNFNNSQDIPD